MPSIYFNFSTLASLTAKISHTENGLSGIVQAVDVYFCYSLYYLIRWQSVSYSVHLKSHSVMRIAFYLWKNYAHKSISIYFHKVKSYAYKSMRF